MVVKGKTQKPIPAPLEGICRKNELKLLGIAFNENPCNWDTQFESMMVKTNSRLYTLRVCKYYGYSLEELSILFDSLITSFFMYGIEVWASAYNNKYLLQIDEFCKRTVRYGYTTYYMPIMERIRAREKQLWGKITRDLNTHSIAFCRPLKPEFSDKEDIILSYLLLKPKDLSVVSLIDVFSTLSSIFFSIVLYLYFCSYI